MKDDIEQLQEISRFFKKINTKLILYKLLNNAKEEYDKYNFEESKQNLEQAYSIEPNNPVTLRGLGCLSQFEGNFENAVKYFKKALEYSKHKEQEYTLIGMAFYLQDKLDDALKYFNLAIDENENFDKAYEGRNQAMLENHLKIVDLQETLKKYF